MNVQGSEAAAGSSLTKERRFCLEVHDLRICFPTADGTVKAVDGISFSLERGAGRSVSSASPGRGKA